MSSHKHTSIYDAIAGECHTLPGLIQVLWLARRVLFPLSLLRASLHVLRIPSIRNVVKKNIYQYLRNGHNQIQALPQGFLTSIIFLHLLTTFCFDFILRPAVPANSKDGHQQCSVSILQLRNLSRRTLLPLIVPKEILRLIFICLICVNFHP